MACKEAANENDRTRKRFGIMCREVLRRFRACITVPGVNEHRAERDAINIVYASLRRDREQADISTIMKELQGIVDDAIVVLPAGPNDESELYDINLLRKPDLSAADIKAIKKVAVELLETLKAEKLRVHEWREKEATRGAVRKEIRDFLWADPTGLPDPAYSDSDVDAKSEAVFRHIHYAYPRLPSPV